MRKILMIVPNVQLVNQGKSDYKSYGDFFTIETIYGMGEQVPNADMCFATFQTLNNMLNPESKRYQPSFFSDFDIICVDECHRASAGSIRNILRNITPIIKFGVSGTLPKKNTIESIIVQAMLGGCIQEINAKDLSDSGYITPIEIKQQYISSNDYYPLLYHEYMSAVETKKYFKNLKTTQWFIDYKKMNKENVVMDNFEEILKDCALEQPDTFPLNAEQHVIRNSENRLTHIINLLETTINKNSILLFNSIDYGKKIYNTLKDKYGDSRKIFYVAGEIDVNNRRNIIETMEKEKDAVLVASYGTLSTGITISNLWYGVFCDSYASEIINMQSLGRTMGLYDGKDVSIIYDLVDVVYTKKIYKHGKQREQLYKKENFKYSKEQVKL